MSDVSNLPGLIKKYPLPWHTAMGGDIKNFQGVWICNAGSMATEIAELANSCGKLADTLTAQHKEIERLREALEPFGRVLSAYGKFAEYQLILLSEDNPKGRRLAHLTPENFYAAAALTGKEGGDG